jgi:hypothetical protein
VKVRVAMKINPGSLKHTAMPFSNGQCDATM